MDVIEQQFITVFKKTFPKFRGKVDPQLTAPEVHGWDSLSHVTFLQALEKHFKITFSVKEVRQAENLGDLLKLIQVKAREN